MSITAADSGAYLDGKPEPLDDGTWVLPYRAHSGADGHGLESTWNQRLDRNRAMDIPVGVFVKDGGTYRNLGLAMVENYDDATRTFILRGPVRLSQPEGTWESRDLIRADRLGLGLDDETDDPVALALVRQRRAQGAFRGALLEAYESRCAITGYNAPEALQGAHILAYSGRSSQHINNGLLLRADVHLLFDRHLLSVDPERRIVRIAPEVRSTNYADLDQKLLRAPARVADEPDAHGLRVHWEVFTRASA